MTMNRSLKHIDDHIQLLNNRINIIERLKSKIIELNNRYKNSMIVKEMDNSFCLILNKKSDININYLNQWLYLSAKPDEPYFLFQEDRYFKKSEYILCRRQAHGPNTCIYRYNGNNHNYEHYDIIINAIDKYLHFGENL